MVETLRAQAVNQSCLCKTLDRAALEVELTRLLGPELLRERPHLFSSTMVFLSLSQLASIHRTVATLERVINSPNYVAKILAGAPAVAHVDHGPRGVFMGLDFHFDGEQARLIEINTNAGGGLLNAKLVRAQNLCCGGSATGEATEEIFYRMFEREWTLQRGERPLRRIAIVDEAPTAQYLYPEFLLFQELFRQHGVEAHVADPADLTWNGRELKLGEHSIDLVYNRLTDFYLEAPSSLGLRLAHEANAVVLTPTPRHHALYAKKTNLVLLSDDDALAALGVSAEDRQILAQSVPKTRRLEARDADRYWEERKGLFFKPASGFGSKAAYRGDKLTKKVWGEIIQGDYVAQELVGASARSVKVGDEELQLKMDFRAYVYEGKVQLLAARLYSGQTTNFRTAGGGFAPVFVL